MPSTIISSIKPETIIVGNLLYLPNEELIGRDSIIYRVMKRGERPFGHSVLVTNISGIYAEVLVVTSWQGGTKTLMQKWRPLSCQIGYCHFEHSDKSQSWSEHPAGYQPLQCTTRKQFSKPGSYLNMRTPYLIESKYLEHDNGPMRASSLTWQSLDFVRRTWPNVQDRWPESWDLVKDRIIRAALSDSEAASDSNAPQPGSEKLQNGCIASHPPKNTLRKTRGQSKQSAQGQNRVIHNSFQDTNAQRDHDKDDLRTLPTNLSLSSTTLSNPRSWFNNHVQSSKL